MDRNMKICLVVKAFLEKTHMTISELAELPELQGISSSSIQRYLNDPAIISLFNQETYDKIQSQLKSNKIDGRRKGGLTYFQNNEAIKSSDGKFVGSVKTSEPSRIENKVKHILAFANIFLSNPEMTLQEIADFVNEASNGKYNFTKAYVYDCLTSKETYNVLDHEQWKLIASQLEQRRIQGNINGALKTNSTNNKKIG